MALYRFPQPPAHAITPEPIYHNRRRLLGLIAGATALPVLQACNRTPAPDVLAEHERRAEIAITRQVDHADGETLTGLRDVVSYNNFYEFGTGKADPARRAHSLRTRPWSVEIAGHAERTGPLDLEDILATHAMEERIYRLRCVEGWSMVIPWLGFPLADLLRSVRPTADARYVIFHTLLDPEQMPGQRRPVLTWPYVEGLRMDEAMHPLAFVATGLYGRELPNQNGAPLRLVVPWKYGFKSIKSIVRIEFSLQQPTTSWNRSAPQEYGFFANVNPDVDHPRWSQSSERRIAGSGSSVFADRLPTRLFNGYADQVASLYAGMDLQRLY